MLPTIIWVRLLGQRTSRITDVCTYRRVAYNLQPNISAAIYTAILAVALRVRPAVAVR
jgi:hypothetical protein